MNHYTIDEVMSWEPCYNREKVKALFAGRRTITLLDVLDMDISYNDKVWASVKMERKLVERSNRENISNRAFFTWLREQLERENEIQEDGLEKILARMKEADVLERLEKVEKRMDAMETLHYKGVAPIDEKGYHNWPEKPKTCGDCMWPYWCAVVPETGLCRRCTPYGKGVEKVQLNTPACPKHEAIK